MYFHCHNTLHKKGVFIALNILCSLFALASCVDQGQITFLEKRVYSLSLQNQQFKQEIDDLKEEISDIKSQMANYKGKELISLRSRQAKFQNMVEETKAEILRISGLIEEMKHNELSLKGEYEAQIKAIKADVDNLRRELRVLGSASSASKENGGAGGHGGGVRERRAGDTADKARVNSIDRYQKALALIKSRKFKEARLSLEAYIKEFPESSLIPNAYFWIGECEYSLRRYEEAILAYEKVIKDFPKSNKAPSALLKEGMAFLKLGDPESAKIIWKRLIRLYPRSDSVQTAKKQLKRIR